MTRQVTIQVRCSQPEKDRWVLAAKQQHQELSPWIRQQLDRASRDVTLPPALPELFPDQPPYDTVLDRD